MNIVHRALRLIPSYRRADEAAGIVPQLQAQLQESHATIQRAAATFSLMRARNIVDASEHDGRLVPQDPRALEYVEAEMMTGAGPSMRRESNADVKQVATVFKERLLELELALDNIGWRRQLAFSDLEFSREGIQAIIKISRLYKIKNPLTKRAVEISSIYVFGRGIEITTDNDAANETVSQFLADNSKELGHIGLTEKDQTLETDGNLFIVLFSDPTGKTTIATIDATEIIDIVTNPNDSSVPWLYKRKWYSKDFDFGSGATTTTSHEEWYPAMRYDPDVRPASIGNLKVNWNTPIQHGKIGGLAKWLYGCPNQYAGLDWFRSYNEFLANWLTQEKAHSRFQTEIETKGGTQAVQNIAKAFGSTVGAIGDANLTDFVDQNPPANTASMFAHGPGMKIIPKSQSGTTDPEKARQAKLMGIAAAGLPETFFGDVNTGNLATATSLDRPTELKFLHRQEWWREFLQTLIGYVLRKAAGSSGNKLRESLRLSEADGAARALQCVPVKRVQDKAGKWIEVWEAKRPSTVTVSVRFPDILGHDIQGIMTAIATGATLNGYTPANTVDPKTLALLILSELGVEDPQAVADAMYPPDTYDPEVDTTEPDPVAPPQAQPGFTPRDGKTTPAAKESRLVDAIAQLREAIGARNGH